MADSNPAKHNELLAEINKEIYEKNLELSIRNRSLSLVRQIYEIINSETDIHKTATKLVKAVIKDLKYETGAIFLLDTTRKNLVPMAAVTTDKFTVAKTNTFLKAVDQAKTSLKRRKNLMVVALKSEQKRVSEDICEVLFEDPKSDIAKEFSQNISLKRFLAVPITFGHKPMGVMLFGLEKTMKEITHAEREIMNELSGVTALAIERSQIYTDLKMANKRLREIDKLKDEFISITSHELRTPMTAIKGYLWMSIHEPGQKLNATLKHNLEVCLGSAERLLQLVSEMLTVSRIQSKRFVLTPSEFDFLGLLQSTFDELSVVAKEKQVEFSFTKSPGNLKHLPIKADKDKIREVFHNLLGNALKFTPTQGKVHVSLIESKGQVSFAVADTGPGILKKDMQKIFTKFGKFEHAYKKIPSTAGSGLGLYICKKIIDLHNGEIEVQSLVDKGTTITVTLPLK